MCGSVELEVLHKMQASYADQWGTRKQRVRMAGDAAADASVSVFSLWLIFL